MSDDKIGIYEFKDSEKDALIKFLVDFDYNLRNYDYWLARLNHWWKDNPSFNDTAIKGWVLKNNNEIVGFMGHIPSKFKFLDKEIDIHCGSSWYVKEEFRGKSMGLFFELIGISNESIIFTTTPSKMVMDILPRFGFQIVSDKDYTYNYIIIINYFNYLRLRLKKYFKSNLISKICSHVLKLYDKNRNSLFFKSLSTNVKILNHADERFDNLWENTNKYYSNTNVRTSSIINWYCFGNKFHKKKLFGYFEDNKLVGYSIFILKEKKLKDFELIDIWFDPKKEESIIQLIKYAYDYGYKKRYDRILLSNLPLSVERIFLKYKFYKSRKILNRRFYRVNREYKDDYMESSKYLVGSQGDYGL